MTDTEFLNWIVERLTNVLGENQNADFIHRLKNIANNVAHLERLSAEIGIRVRLGELFGETKVETWLYKPNFALGDKKPIDLIIEHDFDHLYRLIYRLGSGEPSS